MTLSVLSFNRGGIETIDVGLSIDSPHYSEVKQQVVDCIGVSLHSNLPTLAHLMCKAEKLRLILKQEIA